MDNERKKEGSHVSGEAIEDEEAESWIELRFAADSQANMDMWWELLHQSIIQAENPHSSTLEKKEKMGAKMTEWMKRQMSLHKIADSHTSSDTKEGVEDKREDHAARELIAQRVSGPHIHSQDLSTSPLQESDIEDMLHSQRHQQHQLQYRSSSSSVQNATGTTSGNNGNSSSFTLRNGKPRVQSHGVDSLISVSIPSDGDYDSVNSSPSLSTNSTPRTSVPDRSRADKLIGSSHSRRLRQQQQSSIKVNLVISVVAQGPSRVLRIGITESD